MPVQNRHSFITVSVVLDESIKFRYCSRKLNIQVLACEIEIMSNHLFASVWVLRVMDLEKVNKRPESSAVQCAAVVKSRQEMAVSLNPWNLCQNGDTEYPRRGSLSQLPKPE